MSHAHSSHFGHHHHTKFKACDTSLDFIDDGSMSNFEKLCFIIGELKKLTEKVDGFENELDAKEDSINITNKRLLSELADFTGTWNGDSHTKIITDIANSLLLSQTMIDAINARESIGLIFDGKLFPFVEPVDRIIDGGVF